MLKIALMGTRGIPANYSGFETCVEQLGERLVQRGYQVTVYARTHHISYSEPEYKGMRLVRLRTIENKYLDTLVHTTLSSLHALGQRFDICLYFIAGNSPAVWIPRLRGQKTILNVDGLDWRRAKWPYPAKKYIQFAEYLATILPNAYLTDSRSVQGYYQNRFHSTPYFIPYGSDIESRPPGDILKRFGLTPGHYILFVGRLVPENCAHHLVEAFTLVETEMKCVIVGDAPYAEDYQQSLRQAAAADPRIIFTGYQFGDSYRELGANAYLFVETSSVGGTHPAILEAMAFGNCVIVNNTPENLETIGDTGYSYDGTIGAGSLATILRDLIENPDRVHAAGENAGRRAMDVYSWDAITDAYERLFYEVLKLKPPEPLSSVPIM